MTDKNGELTKKAEMLEIDFLQEMGVDTLGKYPEIEKHIDKLHDILIGENDDLSIADEYDAESIEKMEQEIDDKTDAIDSASYDLRKMKKVVDRIEDSDLKITLLSYIQDMESDLNV